MEHPIIEMSSNYPFGASQPNPGQETLILVHKELPYTDEQQKQTIEQMIHFFKTLTHQHLINLASISQEPSCFHLYYEYVPFRLQSWVLGVNEEMAKQLEEQLLELVEFLSRSNIVFKFDPEAVGLTAQMSVKYFLKEFSLDMDNHNTNCQKLQLDIKQYFNSLKQDVAPVFRNSNDLPVTPSEKPSNIGFTETVSTTGSVEYINQLKGMEKEDYKSSCNSNKSEPSSEKSAKMASIYQKIQNSKQKSMEVLLRLKSFNRKQP